MRDGYAISNSTAEVIPPGAAVEPTGQVDSDGRIVVRKPTVNDSLAVLINGPARIVAGGVGQAYSPYPACVFAVAPADSPGDRASVGVKTGDWFLRTGRKGFMTIGGLDSHRFMNAVPNPLTACCLPDPGSGSGTSGSGSGDSGSGTSGSGTSGSGTSGSGSAGSVSGSGSVGSGSAGSGGSGTITFVSDIGCTPGGSGTRVYYQTVSLATGAVVSNSYRDIGCCGCDAGGSVGSAVDGSGSPNNSGGIGGG